MWLRVLASLFCILFSLPLWGRDYEAQGPLPLRNQNPLHLLFLSPRPEPAKTVPHRELRVSARGSYSNLFEQGASTSTGLALDLDMEIFRPSFLIQYGLFPGWEVGLEIPFLHFEGGFLDSFIQDFHSTFGLPNAGRGLVPNGRFSYAIRQNGIPLYQVDTEPFGLSDLIFHLKKEWVPEGRIQPAVATTTYLKLPTGDRGEGLGSGTPDFSFNVALEKNYRRLHGYLNVGNTFFGGSDVGFRSFLDGHLLTWMAAFEVTAWEPHFSVIIQLQGDSTLFSGTGISALDEPTLVLTVGFAGQEGPWAWKAGFAEDPSGNGPAVDFTTYFEVSYRWGIF